MSTSPDPTSAGYWLAGSAGGVGAFGGTAFDGSMAGTPLHKPIVGMAATADGKGYWEVASDGGIFTFGDAQFYGSMGGKPLNQPIVGMAATPDGKGYWEVAADGGIFTFGDAQFYGSMGGKPLNQPIVGMAATPDGKGYWEVAADGGIFTFGDAPFRGSASGYVPIGESVIGMAPGPGSGTGTSNVGDFSHKVATMSSPYAPGATGYDISWPQCGGAYPPPSAVAVVGVNGGSAFTDNTCFSSEAAWGGANLSVYLNVNSPQGSNPGQWDEGPAGSCPVGDLTCESYNYGYNTAQLSMAAAHAAGYGTQTWWLDVETGNYWTSDTAANDQVIAGALSAITTAGDTAAIYSTDYQWGVIAGTYVPNVAAWYPTGLVASASSSWCATTSFAGGPIDLVQGAAGPYDGDYSC